LIVNNIQTNVKKVSFKGMEQVKTQTGNQAFDFYLPYDKDNYTASIEFVQLKKVGTDFVADPTYTIEPKPLIDGKITVNPSRIAPEGQPFAYRFKLTDKTGQVTYHTDSGLRTENTEKNPDKAKYVVVLRDRAPVTNPGSQIIHLLPDSHNPGWEFDKNGNIVKNQVALDKALNAKRNHFNQYGGNIAGIIQDIPRMAENGYDFVLSTPIFGGDERSSHGYWTTNPFQMTQKNGTLDEFKTLNVELFKKGMSLIADGAFVNEGMEGYRLKHVQKWGKESPYYNNFRIVGNPTISNLPNVDINTPEGKEIFSHIKLHIVNGNSKYTSIPNSFEQTKQQRDGKQLTYVQIYDDRMISEAQRNELKNGKLITKYEKFTPDNHYDVNTNIHSTLLIPFEVPEDEISDFEKRIKDNKGLYSENKQAFLQTVLSFKNFNIDKQANGFETWDGNVDIAKLRYNYTMADEQKMTLLGLSKEEKKEVQQGAYQNQDHIQKVGTYWTKLTKDALIEHSVKEFKNAKEANGYKAVLQGNKNLPTSSQEAMTDAVISNVMTNNYNIPQLETTSKVKDRLTEDLMNLPLESIGFSPDVTAVLGSPFISKKAFAKEDVEKTRYEFFKEKNYTKIPDKYSAIYSDVDDFYTNADKSLVEFASDVISQADTEGKLINKKTNELTDSGKLILPLIANDILKFAMVKSLAPNVKVESKNGKLVYDEKALRTVNLKNLGGVGISAKSPADEAKQTLALMKKGMTKISDSDKKLLSENIKSRFQGVKEADIKMAYVLVDRTASGLNWRTDATKDTAPIGEVRDGLANLGTVMDEAIDFWKGFANAVKKENPNSYIIAEMTNILGTPDDPDALMALTGNKSGRYENAMGLENAFAHETGVSGLSNYNFFFSSLTDLVSTRSDTGKSENIQIGWKKGSFTGQDDWGAPNKNKGFLFNYSQDGVKTSHNFATNHDKPRLLSILALDNKLFHGYLGPEDKPAERLESQQKLDAEADKYTPDIRKAGLTPSYKAIAMAQAIHESMKKANINKSDEEKLKKAVIDLAQGEFQGKKFNADAFGVSPIDFAIKDVILQAETKHNLSLSKDQKEQLFNKTFETIMQPAMDKMLVIDKIMTILPGRNTSFSGDEYGATGYESPCKNLYAQNRNVAHREWINDPSKQFINDYYTTKKVTNNIRKQEGLSALSKGETVVLNPSDGEVLAMFRYDQVSELICIAHSKNVKKDEKDPSKFSINPSAKAEIDRINLAPEENENDKGTVVAGLAGGLALGTYFVNALVKEDKNIFGVCQEENGNYTLRNFAKETDYTEYVKNAKTNATEAIKTAKFTNINLTDNVMVLKKVAAKTAKLAFGSNQNQNHIKIQAYLNSKNYLNTNQKNAI